MEMRTGHFYKLRRAACSIARVKNKKTTPWRGFLCGFAAMRFCETSWHSRGD
jgi:hypothetical protein